MKPTLSAEDKRLVLEARAHWVRMRDDPEGCGEAPLSTDCALCHEYNSGVCIGCPVEMITGMLNCLRTPYHDARDKFFCMRRATLGRTDARRITILAFQKAAQRVIDWIDENLLAPGVSAATEPKCPKCGSTDISLHLCFKDNTAGCRSCRHVWDMESPLAVAPLRESGDPLGLRDMRLGGDAPSLHGEAVLARRRALADDQQLLNGTEE